MALLKAEAWAVSVHGAGPVSASGCACRHLSEFLQRLEDPDHGVRKEAVQLLAAAAVTRPALTAPCIAAKLPMLLQLTVVDDSLVRIVELGPFKQKVDDGLSLRKHTLECVEVRPLPAGLRPPHTQRRHMPPKPCVFQQVRPLPVSI